MPSPRRVLGLMSGTSADGIDAVVCEISGSSESLQAKILGHHAVEFEPELKNLILMAGAGQATVTGIARLNIILGEKFAAAAQSAIHRFGPVDLIGSHGQTVCHLPGEGVTLQIGEPAIIAARTGVPVVADFRQADMAAGGQGAPLVPYVDWALFRSPDKNRILLNIGGIANVTILAAGCSLAQVRGWDTGPGNMVMDYWTKRLWSENYDENGHHAAHGKVQAKWLDDWLEHPYFSRRPPKTCGREEFGTAFATLVGTDEVDTKWGHDILATATWLTSHTIADSIRQDSGLTEAEILVAGGGAHNAHLMALLQQELPALTVKNFAAEGMEPQHKEALAFAVLAHETMNGVPTNVPGVTGASQAVVLGKIVRP